METGEVSEKIKRGRHTTRHSELIRIEKDTYVLDTPGFSSLFIHMFEEDEIKDYFRNSNHMKMNADSRDAVIHMNQTVE